MSAVPVTEQTITARCAGCRPSAGRRCWRSSIPCNRSRPRQVPAHGPAWTATELRKLPPAERDAILAEQAAALADEYRNNPELTAFEAFGDEDLYVDSSDSEAG